jgi:hypothetical protein
MYRKIAKTFMNFLQTLLGGFFLLLANMNTSQLSASGDLEPHTLYPTQEELVSSPGSRTYFVDPVTGIDSNGGTSMGRAWKSIARLNHMRLSPGDCVVIAPGLHEETLKPSAFGTSMHQVTIKFLPGIHEFSVDNALRRPWFISNSCDAPQIPKPIGILVENCRHLRLEGDRKAEIRLGGRMIEFINNHSEDIQYSGLTFDLKRPTVSEFRVLNTDGNGAEVQIAEGSTYEIKEGHFAWTGDIGSGWVMAQQADPQTGKCWRMGQWDPFQSATASEIEPGKVRLTYAKGHFEMEPGRQFQFRHVIRDSAGGHNNLCKDIVFRDCDFYALTNMGIVSQFTENITFQRVRVAPPAGTIRTCPSWADAFHFSSCKGKILVEACEFSGLQDDPINVHGTHLRIVEKTAENALHVRFMQSQTYGFPPFVVGDEIAVIDHSLLRELPGNLRRKVTSIAPLTGDTSGKEWEIRLNGPAPKFGMDDVVDNLTWYPDFTARNNFVTMDSCRGFLITTRGKVVVEGNLFNRCAMPGILISDDAHDWFESGPVRDVTIRNNQFIGCGIEISPQTSSNDPNLWVHENIRIEGNTFSEGAGIVAAGVRGLTIISNIAAKVDVKPSCSKVLTDGKTVLMSLPIPPKLAAPAKRALAEASITSLEQLQTKLEAEILAMHGMGPNAMKILRQAMADADVHFKPVS